MLRLRTSASSPVKINFHLRVTAWVADTCLAFDVFLNHGLKIPQPLVQSKAGDRLIEGSNLALTPADHEILQLPTFLKTVAGVSTTLI